MVRQHLNRDKRSKNAPGELERAGLWHRCEGGAAAGYQIAADLANLQLTKAEVEERNRKRADAGRGGGVASGRSRRAKAEANIEANASTVVQAFASTSANPVPSRPVPSRPDPRDKSTDAAIASASLHVDEPTHEMLCKLFHLHWAAGDTTSRIAGVKDTLHKEHMHATEDALQKAERVVHHVRAAGAAVPDAPNGRRGQFQSFAEGARR